VQSGDCNEYLRNRLAKRVDWSRWRGVVFLDPFGMQVPWATLKALGSAGGIEIILNLPIGMAIQRLLKRSAEFSAEERRRLDDYFGDPGWYPLLYEEGTDLFGEPRLAKEESAGYDSSTGTAIGSGRHSGAVSDAYLVSQHERRPSLLPRLGRAKRHRSEDREFRTVERRKVAKTQGLGTAGVLANRVGRGKAPCERLAA